MCTMLVQAHSVSWPSCFCIASMPDHIFQPTYMQSSNFPSRFRARLAQHMQLCVGGPFGFPPVHWVFLRSFGSPTGLLGFPQIHLMLFRFPTSPFGFPTGPLSFPQVLWVSHKWLWRKPSRWFIAAVSKHRFPDTRTRTVRAGLRANRASLGLLSLGSFLCASRVRAD